MFIYAETALHHEGDLDYLYKLIDCAAEAGAQGVKFQVTLDHSSVMSEKHTLYKKCEKMLITEKDWGEVFRYTKSKGLKIILMPLDCQTIEKVLDKMFLPDYLDLHSISFYDLQLLKLIKKTKIPLILALGGRTGDELIEKIDYFGNQIYCIMVGFQSFPTKFDDIIIEKINTLKSLYGEIHIGYADHSQYDDSSMIVNNEYALKLGATVFEKHITIEEGIKRIDYISAINKNKFSKLVNILKKSKTADYKFLDIDLDYLAPSEIKYRNREKYAVAAKKLNKGEVINCNNISYKLIDKGLVGYNQNDAIPNLKLNTDVEYDDIILQEHFI